MEVQGAYLSQPDIFEDTIVYVTDDDIWKASTGGGLATRLTNSDYFSKEPAISPGG